MLQCELSRAASVEWKKKHKVLKSSEKYTLRQEGTTAQLLIHALEVKDAGEYTCVCGGEKTTAALTVHGKNTGVRTSYVARLLSPPEGSVLPHHEFFL